MKNTWAKIFGIISYISITQMAFADIYSTMISTMLATGMAKRDTVNHNISIYEGILNSIEENIDSKKFVLAQLDNLSQRIDVQLGYTSTFAPLIFPDLYSALSEARAAILANDHNRIFDMTSRAKTKLSEIKKL